MGLPKRVTLDSVKAAALDGANDNPSSSSRAKASAFYKPIANTFTLLSRPRSPLPSPSKFEIEAFDAEPDAMEEDDVSISTSEGEDDYESVTLGKGVCPKWKEPTFDKAIQMFKFEISTEWIFLFLRSMHKSEKIKLDHVARFRTLWERSGRKNSVKDL